MKTFGQVARLWYSGALARMYPDDVQLRVPKAQAALKQQLTLLCETVGKVPLDEFTEAHLRHAMEALPRKMMRSTRNHYWRSARGLLKLCKHPLGLIKKNPIESVHGVLEKGIALPSYLLWSEFEQLMGCQTVPYRRRTLWAYLYRTGVRVAEAQKLQWKCVNFEEGYVEYDGTFTKDAAGRMFALSPDVDQLLAKLLTIATKRGRAKPHDFVFWRPGTVTAAQFREDLKACGVDRPSLFKPRREMTGAAKERKQRRRITIHSLRSSYIIYALAFRHDFARISQTTGHSFAKFNHYRKAGAILTAPKTPEAWLLTLWDNSHTP